MIDIRSTASSSETQFVEMTGERRKALGIDFANRNGQIAWSLSIPVSDPARFTRAATRSRELFGTCDSAGFQAALRPDHPGNGRIVSRPRIAAQSGSTAKIITGDALRSSPPSPCRGHGVSQQVQYVMSA